MNKIRLLTNIALFVAIGLVLQVIDSSIPLPLPIVGGKLGLANIANICSLLVFPPMVVFIIAIIRAFLGGLIFGGGIAIIYSLVGSFGAIVISLLLVKCQKISLIGVGIMAAVTHNLFQVLVAVVVLKNYFVFSYLPVLMIVSAFSGSLTGYIGELFNARKNYLGFNVAKAD